MPEADVIASDLRVANMCFEAISLPVDSKVLSFVSHLAVQNGKLLQKTSLFGRLSDQAG